MSVNGHLRKLFRGCLIVDRICWKYKRPRRRSDIRKTFLKMKIEKISDNKIRCTLTKSDLEQRQIRLSEFAYGTDKAKQLFHEMMLRAHKECGWPSEGNIPLMIEAIPDKENSLVLIITRVDDPEELDTRFAKFTASNVKPEGKADIEVGRADDILDVFKKFFDQKKGPKAKKTQKAPAQPVGKDAQGEDFTVTRAFTFRDIDGVIMAASALRGFYKGSNTLYRDNDGVYTLVIRQSSHSPEEFNRICNILTEYAAPAAWSAPLEAHMSEHDTTVIKGSAVQQLAKVTDGPAEG